MLKKALGILILIYALLILLYTPLQSNFLMHIGEPNFKITPLAISISLINTLHIIGYGIMALLFLHYLSGVKVNFWKIFVIVFIYSIFIEVSQIFFVEGHCRLRDLIPNIMGIIIVFCLYNSFSKRQSEMPLKKAIIINLSVVIILVLLALFST